MAAKGTILLDTEDGPEILATAILEVAAAAKKLLASRLTRRALLLLIKDRSGVGIREIEDVLVAASQLDQFVVKPKVNP